MILLYISCVFFFFCGVDKNLNFKLSSLITLHTATSHFCLLYFCFASFLVSIVSSFIRFPSNQECLPYYSIHILPRILNEIYFFLVTFLNGICLVFCLFFCGVEKIATSSWRSFQFLWSQRYKDFSLE
jgi:hypothetical protein